VINRNFLALLFFILTAILAFPELFFQSQTLFTGDLAQIHYPLKVFAAEQWRSGHVPLWNPHVLLGFPMLAEGQVGVLYPFNFFFLLPIPTYFALTLFVTFHCILASFSTYILARLLGRSYASAIISGLSFGFSGFIMAQIVNLNIMSGGSWLPLVFAGVIYTLQQKRWSVAAGCSLPLALQILTSQPQIVFYTVLFILGYTFWHTWLTLRQQPAQAYRDLALVGLLLLLSLMLSSPQLLSSWELKNLSLRAEGLSYNEIVISSLPPLYWLTLLFPSLLGNEVNSKYVGLGGNFNEMSLYVGLLPLLMVVVSWRERRHKFVLFLWLILPIIMLLAAGRYMPLAEIILSWPLFNLFRITARWSLISQLVFALLAAWGLDSCLRQPLSRQMLGGLIIFWLIITLSFIFVPHSFLATAFPETKFTHLWQALYQYNLFEVPHYYHDRLILSWLNGGLMPQSAFVTRFGAIIGLLIIYSTRYINQFHFKIAAITLTLIDVVLSGGTAINPITTATFWQQQSPAVQTLLQPAPHVNRYRIFSTADNTDQEVIMGLGQYFPTFYHISAASGYKTPLLLQRHQKFLTALAGNKYLFLALSLTSTRWVIMNSKLEQHLLPLLYEDTAWRVYENPHALPRALVVHKAMLAESSEQVLAFLQQDMFDPRSTVVLETTLAQNNSKNDEINHSEKMEITRDDPTSIEIEVDLLTPGYLVLLDNYYPGWTATVDGTPTPILHANYFARAISLPLGYHTIHFNYWPRSFQLGLMLSATGWVIIVGLNLLKLKGVRYDSI